MIGIRVARMERSGMREGRATAADGGPAAGNNEEVFVRRLVALAAALFVFAPKPAAFAQEQQSFKTIIGKGYDIKSVTFARGESTENREIFVVTLQKEKSVAVCYFAAVNWINLSSGTLEDSRRCDVR
jgi:hypothetical protein